MSDSKLNYHLCLTSKNKLPTFESRHIRASISSIFKIYLEPLWSWRCKNEPIKCEVGTNSPTLEQSMFLNNVMIFTFFLSLTFLHISNIGYSSGSHFSTQNFGIKKKKLCL